MYCIASGVQLEARSALKLTIEQDRSIVCASLATAIASFRAGSFADAERICCRLLVAEPENASAYNILAVIAYERGDYDLALSAINKAVENNANEPEIFNNQGVILQAMGCINDAIASFKKVVFMDPDFWEAHTNLAEAVYKTGHPEQALRIAEFAIARHCETARLHNLRGVILKRMGLLKDAIVAYRRALFLDPAFVLAEFNLGLALEQLDRHEDAIGCWQRIISLAPTFVDAYIAIALVYLDQNELEQAEVWLRKAVAIAPDSVDALINLGLVLHNRNLLDDAIECYQRAIEV
ncbi:MAG: tetratricopeptide repeat protein, partial [Pseudomonadota bacterium]